MTSSKSFLFSILLLKAVLLSFLIIYGNVHLAPDEAQYWFWGQNLDFGYYSKPPGIAWQIGSTTALFGNTEFGVRFGALLIGLLIPCVLYATSRKIGLGKPAAFWAALAFALSPLGFYLSFAATTDGGVTLFLMLALCAVLKEPNYLLAGFFILLGALFKWTAFFFWPIILIAMLFYKPLRKKSILLGIAISLLALLPTLYWNWGHDFATFRHVFNTVAATQSKKGGNFFAFLISQIALFSPIFFALVILGISKAFKKGFPIALCALFSTFSLFYFVLSAFKKMQPNWALYLYPPAFIVMAYYAIEVIKKRLWIYLGAILSLLMVIGAFAIPYTNLKYSLNPFRQNMGWRNLEKTLSDAGYNPLSDFLFADKYQTASILTFYVHKSPRVYFFNLNGGRKNQFSYYPQMEVQEIGKSGYFVIVENRKESELEWYKTHYLSKLQPFFKEVTYLGHYSLYRDVKHALLFKGTSYNGQKLTVINKY